MTDQSILTARDGAVATVTMNRPDVHNAFNDAVIATLTDTLRELGADAAVRAVVLRANGKSFSAGADLGWMRRMADYGEDENLADARALGGLMRTLATLPKPTVALVHGAAFGGGVGLVACCDIAIAAETAVFSLTEVRLGLIPAVISPYVVEAIGPRAARRVFLTAERISALEAHRLGLVHEVVPGHMLEAALERILGDLAQGGPAAQAGAKDLITAVAGRPPESVAEETARLIARARAGAEGREGVSAFLEKRAPAWRPAPSGPRLVK